MLPVGLFGALTLVSVYDMALKTIARLVGDSR